MPKVKSVEKRALDLKAGAEYLSVSQDFLRKRIETKEIPSFKLGDLVRVKIEDLDSYLDKCERK